MKLRTSSIIHAFALLHVATAVLCRLLNLGDELALTTLTIVLTVILCLRYRQSVEFSSIVIIIANILGYLLGNGIAALAGTFINHPLLSPRDRHIHDHRVDGLGTGLLHETLRRQVR